MSTPNVASKSGRGKSRKSGRYRPVPFDFRRPIKFRREHVRLLEIVNETFARQFSTVLSTRLRSVTQIQMDSVEQYSYDEHIRTIPNPSFIAIVSLHPLQGAAMFHVPVPIAMAAIDRLLGGNGSGQQPQRALTDIENALMNDLTQRIFDELPYAYAQLVESVRPRVISIESNPQFAQITSASDMVIVISFEVTIGMEHDFATLCIPFNSLQPVLEAQSGRKTYGDISVEDRQAVKSALRESMHDVEVELSAQFNSTLMLAKDVYSLQAGDIVPLGHPISEPLQVKVDGVTCYKAVPGKKGKRIAAQIIEDAWEDEE